MRGTIMGAAALVAAMATPAVAELSSSVRRDSQVVEGLQQPAEILLDRWGVPHIYAQTSRDAFFLQGWNAARDRLWQIDLWRKRGLGRLAASFGPAYAEQDRAARLFLYRGDMATEWAAYDPIGREAVEAFAAGVNAYVADVDKGTKPLPVEFRLTSSRPEPWAAEDILRIRSHALVSNAASEASRARAICKGGLEADALRRRLEPEHTPGIPKGLDPCDVPDDVMKDYMLGTAAVSFAPLAKRETAAAAGTVDLARFLDEQAAEGSNNWVIAGSRTASGRPILANDPHRPVGAPSLRYIAHLDAPGLSIIGAGEPALPGISFGHNGRAAFGLTIFYIDQEDLYVYETRGDSYRYKGGWEPMQVVRETIEVKGEASRPVELRFTRHGPVLKADPTGNRAFALRTVWNEPGLAGYFGSSRMWRAGSWEDFQAVRNRWGAPPLNLVYADVTGQTGWAAAGRTPVRRNWDGLLPVPGDGRYEWAGFLADDRLPVSRNPAEGFFATANEMNVPADPAYPRATRRLAFEWSDRTRSIRIREVLSATPRGTLADSMALQVDTVSPQARRGQALLAPLASDDPEVAGVLALMKVWDADMRIESAEAAIYETWALKHLGRAVVGAAAPKAAQGMLGASSPDPILLWLERQSRGVRDPLLLASLRATLDELKARLGPDMNTWSWGRLHHARFEPAVAVLADRPLAAQMSVGPLQTPGSSSTPRAATWRNPDFRQTAGASVRLVMDVGGWDNSMAVNTPGQSGDPFSAHYRDLFPLWSAGGYFPLRFTRTAVEAETEAVLVLTPP
jgi:penicillin amidase